MSIYRLSDASIELFVARSEVAPNLQYGRFGEYLVHVIDSVVARVLDGQQDQPHERDFPWLKERDQAAREEVFTEWLQALPPIDVAHFDEIDLYRYWVSRGINPRFPPPGPAMPPPPTNLPFTTNTSVQDVFYRYEPFPVSRRINQTVRTVAPGTFASPASELLFMPTGFAAVARNALPLPYPACFRWELQPNPVTIRCGAIVPSFGQSGGGVEVCFIGGAVNRGPIANPVVLSPM